MCIFKSDVYSYYEFISVKASLVTLKRCNIISSAIFQLSLKTFYFYNVGCSVLSVKYSVANLKMSSFKKI